MHGAVRTVKVPYVLFSCVLRTAMRRCVVNCAVSGRAGGVGTKDSAGKLEGAVVACYDELGAWEAAAASWRAGG